MLIIWKKSIALMFSFTSTSTDPMINLSTFLQLPFVIPYTITDISFISYPFLIVLLDCDTIILSLPLLMNLHIIENHRLIPVHYPINHFLIVIQQSIIPIQLLLLISIILIIPINLLFNTINL